MDGLFQSKFTGFEAEPPAGVWNNIHTELHGKGGGSFNPVNLASLAALLLISGLLGFSIIQDAPSASNINPQPLEQQISMIADDAGVDIPVDDRNSAIDNTNFASQTASVIQQPSASIDNKGAKNKNNSANNTSHNTIHEQSSATSYSSEINQQADLAKLKTRRSFGLHTNIQTTNTSTIAVRDSKHKPKYAGVNDGERQYLRRAQWQMGVFFTPEVIFYPADSIENQRGYTFDVSAKWIKNEFFIESGLGVSFSSDNGKYAIDYEQYLGTYDDVYNVTFDSTENGVTPVYHTAPVDVYDTISKYKIEQVKNNYTYLQIPLYVGFQKQVNRFGWFVKGGPVFNVLLNSNIPDPVVGDDRIVDLNQQMPMRVKTSWQFAVSAGFSYKLSDKVSVAIEPTFRYYLNSQYERKYITTKHPYSIGLRTGLLFNF